MLDESIFLDEIFEFLRGYEVVLFAMNFAWPRRSSGVLRSDQSVKGKGVKNVERETLKPNLSGNSANRRWSRVLFPTPEGPERTRGRRKSERGDMPVGVRENLRTCDMCDVTVT